MSGNQCSFNKMSEIDVALAGHSFALGLTILAIYADRVNFQPSLEQLLCLAQIILDHRYNKDHHY